MVQEHGIVRAALCAPSPPSFPHVDSYLNFHNFQTLECSDSFTGDSQILESGPSEWKWDAEPLGGYRDLNLKWCDMSLIPNYWVFCFKIIEFGLSWLIVMSSG